MERLILIFLFASFLCTAQKDSSEAFVSSLGKDFSGQVTIHQNDELILKQNFGNLSLEQNIAIVDSCVFNIGKTSEMFTFYFIQHLANVGQLKIFDPVQKYLPDFPYANINLWHLINHQSGLPEDYIRLYHKFQYQNMDIKKVDKEICFTNSEILDLLAKTKPTLSFEPGAQQKRAAINYLILASVIERITFTPHQDFVRRIFKHQHFTFSPILSTQPDTILYRAKGYITTPSFEIKSYNSLFEAGFPYADCTYGHQNLYMSAYQLALWGRFYFPQIDISGVIESGFIMGLTYNSEQKILYSSGAVGGNWSGIYFLPNEKILITITRNICPPNLKKWEDDLLKEIEKKFRKI